MTIKEIFSKLKSEKKKELPLSFSVGMLMSVNKVRPVYPVMLSIISFFALYGSFFTFISACGERFFFSGKKVWLTVIISWAVFSLIYGISHSNPSASRCAAVIFCGGTLLFGIIKIKKIIYGIKYFTNCFMASLFIKYAEEPVYKLESTFNGQPPEKCAELALCCMIVISAAVVCRTVKTPNLLLFICATFPLPELCLYFGLVPDYKAFVMLCAAWCGAAAAEVTRLNMFSDKGSDRIFAKTGAQSGFAAFAVMLMSFLGAFIYADVTDFERPACADNFRKGFIVYMKDFSWSKLKEDISDAVLPPKDKKMTHDGKLGNVDNVKFSGKNMLEVTLPTDAKSVYLKGFTGTYYTGSKWEKGEAVPPLDTNITSPEFFSARVLKAYPEFSSLPAKDVIVRNTGVSSGVKYYPSNAAGMLETDGKRRRYGVYFPERSDWQNVVMNFAEYIVLNGTMQSDELKLRNYAYQYCLDVPETFTADGEFFKDLKYSGTEDILKYIRRELAKRCSYTLDSGKKPLGTDFAQWFLTENKSGSCTHFASAAVLLCRSRGIPARYCEGFIIKPEDIKNFKDNDGYTTVSVPDSRAHAWAEVYIDGYGWLIFESTPGYGNMAFDTNESPENWEHAAVSEITSVATEAPVFSETVTEMTAVTEGESAAEMTDVHNSGSAVTAVTGTGTDAMETAYGGADDPARQTDAKGSGTAEITVTGSDYAAQGTSEQAFSGTSGITPAAAPEKELPAAVRYLLIFFCAAAVVCALTVIRRRYVLSLRKKLLETDPEKAAAKIYKLLLTASRADNDPDTLAEKLIPLGVEKECTDVIVSTAQRARFGCGIEQREVLRSAEALSAALECLKEKNSSFMTVIGWLNVTDRFI